MDHATDHATDHARRVVTALRAAHDRLEQVVAELGEDGPQARSYDDEWTVAQVLGHLGSGAEIFTRIVGAAAEGEPVPGRELFKPTWDAWNARTPEQQVADSPPADRGFVELMEGLDESQLARKIDLFGMNLNLAEIGRMRLSELVLHTWDVAVMSDPEATLDADAVALLVDHLGQTASRSGRPGSPPFRARVVTSAPEGSFELVTGDPVSLVAQEPQGLKDGLPILELPAESLIRLVAGRLDPSHTPAEVVASGVSLDALRETFPGL